jgi:hypothetical protein
MPSRNITIEAFMSAFSTVPQFVQTNSACEIRDFLSTVPQELQV